MRERVLLIAYWLSLTTRWRRLRDRARANLALTGMLLLAAAAAVVLLGSALRSPAIRNAVGWLIENVPVAGLAAGLYLLLVVSRHRARLRTERAHSWLLPTPVSKRAFATLAGVRIALAAGVHASCLLAAILAGAFANGIGFEDVRPICMSMIVGIASGGLIGALWPLGKVPVRSEDSRFIRRMRPGAMTPSLAGLSRWPIAKALAWHRPENSRFLFVIAALSVPVGASALLGLAILAVWTLGSYMFAVLRAVPAVAAEAASWLRPTSLPFASFASSIAGRAFVHQLLGTALLGAIFVGLGGRIGDGLYLASVWLATTTVVWTIGLRQSYRALPSFARTLCSVLLVLVAETRARGWGLALAGVVSLIHVRGLRDECA